MPPPPTLTESEIDRLLYFLKSDTTYSACPANRPRNYLLGCLMADAGLRVSEAVSLSPGHLFEPNQNSASSVTWTNNILNSIYLEAKTAKGVTSRAIPLTERITFAADLFYQHNKARLASPDWRWLFPGRSHTTHITTRQVHRIIDRAGRMTLHRPVHPHLLRHTFGTRIVRSSNTSVAQQLLGHKSLTSTQVYLHPGADDLQKAIESLNKPKGQ